MPSQSAKRRSRRCRRGKEERQKAGRAPKLLRTASKSRLQPQSISRTPLLGRCDSSAGLGWTCRICDAAVCSGSHAQLLALLATRHFLSMQGRNKKKRDGRRHVVRERRTNPFTVIVAGRRGNRGAWSEEHISCSAPLTTHTAVLGTRSCSGKCAAAASPHPHCTACLF